MTRRRLVRPTGLLAEHAAMETERDDALLRAERAETRETELEQEVDRLKGKLRRRSDTIADLTSQIAELRKYVAGVKSAEARIAKAERERIAAAAKRKYGLVIGRGIEEIANVRAAGQ